MEDMDKDKVAQDEEQKEDGSDNGGDTVSAVNDEERSPQNDKTTKPGPDSTSNTVLDSPEVIANKEIFKMPMFGTKIKKKTGLVSEAFGAETIETDSYVRSEKEMEKKEVKQKKHSSKPYVSPAQALKQSEIPLPYKEPAWGGLVEGYSFEVIRNGTVIDTVDLGTKSFHIFGRLPSCDVTLEHPSLSRYHAVVQFCQEQNERHDVGWYLYDLDSTHGTWINKNQVKPRVYNRLHVGHVVKFGGSSRLFILQGPPEDMEEESDLSLTEMKAQRERQKREAELLKQADLAEAEDAQKRLEKAGLESQQGCSWGIDEDAVEDNENTENPFALTAPQNEDLYIADPKKALKGYFEREGLELPEYKTEDAGHCKHKCWVELPIDDVTGRPIIAQVTVEGKKREAVVECALEACRILDKHGELRKSTHESHARKKRNWEDDDFYDSDEDTFLDRTGDIEKKRQMRMKMMGKKKEKAETFESLSTKLSVMQTEITELQNQLDKAKQNQAAFEEEGMDAFDAYMESLKSGALDTKTKMKMKRELLELRKEQMRVQKLLAIARPALPQIQPRTAGISSSNKHLTAPMYGKMKGLSRGTAPIPVHAPSLRLPSSNMDEQDVEEEEDEEEEDKQTSTADTSRISPTSSTKCIKDSNKDSLQLSETGVSPNCDKDMNSPTSPDSRLEDSELKKHTASESVSSVEPVTFNPSVTPPRQGPECPSQPNTMETEESSVSEVSSLNDMQPTTKSKVNVSRAKIKRQKVDEAPPVTDPDYNELQDDPNYHVWVPPQGQTGDGKTSLNAKYGY